MTDKTKAKIEAMAGSRKQHYLAAGNVRESRVAHESVKIGATPFAEWCERFEKAIESYLKDGDTQLLVGTTLKEYRQWLEER